METVKCKERGCPNYFDISDEEMDHFTRTIKDKTTGEEIKLQPPKRCPECRAKRRAERSQ